MPSTDAPSFATQRTSRSELTPHVSVGPTAMLVTPARLATRWAIHGVLDVSKQATSSVTVIRHARLAPTAMRCRSRPRGGSVTAIGGAGGGTSGGAMLEAGGVSCAASLAGG